MKIIYSKTVAVRVLAFLFSVLATCTMNISGRAATLAYTEGAINSFTSVSDALPDSLHDVTGADVQVGPILGTNNLAFVNTPGNYVIKKVTDAAFAKSSLSNGTLKTFASLQLGANTFVSGSGIPLGVRDASASGRASFADSFRAYSGNTPFLWTTGNVATFHFNVTGQVTTNGTIPNPINYIPPQPIDLILAQLSVNIYKPGTIDLLRQAEDFDFNAYTNFNDALAAFLAIENQIQTNFITSDYWDFGQLIANFTNPPSKILPIDPSIPTPVDFTFTPGGDFDWVVSIDTSIQLDANLQNVSATLNFSNSMVSTYQGPPGTTTFSGSGLYPGTLPFSLIPPPTTGKCPQSLGYWKNHPGNWPVISLTLGSQTYNQTDLLKILSAPAGGDASQILGVQLIAAKLNIANGSDPAPISGTVLHADGLLAGFSGKLPYKVKPATIAGNAMTSDASTLDAYNNQFLTPQCTP